MRSLVLLTARYCPSVAIRTLWSLSNHDDHGNKNVTKLKVWRWKTIVLPALHVHFLSLNISQTFSLFPRREMACSAVVWRTWECDGNCSILPPYFWSAGVSRKTRQLIEPEKQFLKLWSAGHENQLFYYVSDIRKGKLTANFQRLERGHIEDAKGFMTLQTFWDIRETGPWFQFYSRIIRSHFASVMTLNNIKMTAETRSYIFRWRSRCGRRRLCLSSLLPSLTTPSKAMC